ncbi:hypothetical protein NC653_039092 [Populus alba x Populus x berolinensis]|uniref:Uncharacterized protein n=1 Tax=Populus alba x Populus x berolinensis TaxID=444605 RepID=A0AAD6LB78_9ROSI|nr:hypothetical protein NC653_039092 [Populus alba x Populus x berolinensis]
MPSYNINDFLILLTTLQIFIYYIIFVNHALMTKGLSKISNFYFMDYLFLFVCLLCHLLFYKFF